MGLLVTLQATIPDVLQAHYFTHSSLKNLNNSLQTGVTRVALPGSLLNGVWLTRAFFLLLFLWWLSFFNFFSCDCNYITACFPSYSPNPASLLALLQIMCYFLLVFMGDIYVLSACVCVHMCIHTCTYLFLKTTCSLYIMFFFLCKFSEMTS